MAVSINILNRKWNHSLIEGPFTFETLLTLLWYVKVSQFIYLILFFGDSWNLKKNYNIFKFHESQQKQHMVYKLRPLKEHEIMNAPPEIISTHILVDVRKRVGYDADKNRLSHMESRK